MLKIRIKRMQHGSVLTERLNIHLFVQSCQVSVASEWTFLEIDNETSHALLNLRASICRSLAGRVRVYAPMQIYCKGFGGTSRARWAGLAKTLLSCRGDWAASAADPGSAGESQVFLCGPAALQTVPCRISATAAHKSLPICPSLSAVRGSAAA